MASKSFARTLRAVSKQTNAAKPVQKRTFSSALAVRPIAGANAKTNSFAASQQQSRGLKTIDFAGTKETVFGMKTSMLVRIEAD